MCNLETLCIEQFLEQLQWYCPQQNVNRPQHWFRLWLGAWWHQAITWTNVDPDLYGYIVSLGHNELMQSHPFCTILLIEPFSYLLYWYRDVIFVKFTHITVHVQPWSQFVLENFDIFMIFRIIILVSVASDEYFWHLFKSWQMANRFTVVLIIELGLPWYE